ncbi:MAG: substrate-binding domain-containing protein [Oscillospiraceae bacterium]|nr:substrate-binding domain-containing protein [Oscillospiraceae bacterium]
MKKWFAGAMALLLLLSLAACAKPVEQPKTEQPQAENVQPQTENVQPQTQSAPQDGQFVFTRENFPRLNGSTAMVPLGQAIASVLLGETREEVADLTNFSRTTQSYRELMRGDADLLISGAPPESIYEEKKELGFEWEISTFAVDGLVFVVNENNPVDSLTVEQIQKIYSGEITNWSEVGGDDVDIVPFQRNEEAGSQTAMKKLVMGDIPLMEAPAEYVSGAMSDLVKVVASYSDSAAAIGYTVYYYAHDMKMAEGLKLLAVNGVQPSAETIRSRDYPFINDSYVVIKAGLPDDAPAKILYNWVMSEEGQRLVAHEGYVSITDVGGAS